MYAIIETGGRQFVVSEGDIIRTDLVDVEVGSDVIFDRVLIASGENAVAAIGNPSIEGAKVTGTVVGQKKDKKILVFKYKPKKRVRKLVGHRQRFAEVKITKIELPS
jgi:large subunit ribosomal protein L21